MSKLNRGYTPSKSEIYLLTLLVAVGIIALSLHYLILPQWTVFQETRQQQEVQTTLVEKLRAEYSQLDTYRQEEGSLAQKLGEMESMLPAYYAQEEILTAMNEISAESGLTLSSVAFGGVNTQAQDEFISSLNRGQEQVAPEAAPSGDQILSERVLINFAGNYGQFKTFLTNFEGATRKVFFRALTMSRGTDDVLNGTLDMLVFSTERGAESTGDYPGYPYDAPAPGGKDDPFAAFDSAQGGGGVDSLVQSTPDFYVILNTYDDNASKILMGKYPSSGAQLTSESNGEVQAALTLSPDGAEYRYTYTLGGRSRSGTITLGEGQTELLINILSRERKSGADKVGMMLSVKNETDLPVSVQVKNEDQENPRFRLGAVSGSVQIVD